MRERVPLQEGRHKGRGSARLRGLAPLGRVPPGLPGLGAAAHQVSSRLSVEAGQTGRTQAAAHAGACVAKEHVGRPSGAHLRTQQPPVQTEGRRGIRLLVHPPQGQPASLGTMAALPGSGASEGAVTLLLI